MRWSYYSAPAALVNPVYLREIKKPLEYPEAFRLSEKSKDFSDSLKNAVTFAPQQRRKSPRFACRNPCTARLPGHLIPFEAGGCPLELPRPNLRGIISTEVF